MSDFMPDDKWATRVLKVHGDLYLTDWSSGEICDAEIEVTKLLPEGKQINVGVLGSDGIFDVIIHGEFGKGGNLEVVTHATWDEIEVLPEWKFDE